MAKLVNVRERVHQPFRDCLIRTSGSYVSAVQDQTQLFTVAGGDDGRTNLKSGNMLTSDQSMVILALRVFLHFRNPIQRGPTVTVSGGTDYPQKNGDFQYGAAGSTLSAAQSAVTNGNAPGSIQDVYRLYAQAQEQLFWSFGAEEKYSLKSMPTSYMPWGGGLDAALGGATDLVHLNNGTPDQSGILRLARAILLPPRQGIKCEAKIVALPDTNQSLFALNQGSRVLTNLKDNLNTADLVTKVIAFAFDGLWSRDVQ